MASILFYFMSLLLLITFFTGTIAQLYYITNYQNKCMSYYPTTGSSAPRIVFISCNSKDSTQKWKLISVANSAYMICANDYYCMSVNYGSLCTFAYLLQKNPSDTTQHWKTLANNTVTNVFLSSAGYNLCTQSAIGQYLGVIVNYINMIDCYNIPPQKFKINPLMAG